MYKTGVVRSFISDKGFGFIEVSKGEKNVFFHISKGKKIKLADNDAVVFSNTKETRVPVVGDKLIFVNEEGEKGLFASSWGFQEDKENVPLANTPNVELLVKKKMVIDAGQEAHVDKIHTHHIRHTGDKKRGGGSEEPRQAKPYNRAKQKYS